NITGPFRAAGKPVSGLETLEEQFGFFDHLSEDSQRKFLVAVLDSPEETKKQFAEMLAAWSNGDLAGIARSFDDETQMSAELRQVLMAQRNARWADWLKARMEKPGVVFVAVGAGHLAGKDSVEAMLEARGLKVQRVQ
ncbi:MAG: TraB/GumN family protein, partial [Alphaproteobacteria bacterium]|nr:TraB/GumN family protein [Alphaproteobacteria bacterium]